MSHISHNQQKQMRVRSRCSNCRARARRAVSSWRVWGVCNLYFCDRQLCTQFSARDQHPRSDLFPFPRVRGSLPGISPLGGLGRSLLCQLRRIGAPRASSGLVARRPAPAPAVCGSRAAAPPPCLAAVAGFPADCARAATRLVHSAHPAGSMRHHPTARRSTARRSRSGARALRRAPRSAP